MCRIFTIFLLIVCMSFQCILRMYVVSWFKINEAYIIANLCENKDQPEVNCCGKCVLNKAFSKIDDVESQSKKNSKNLDFSSQVIFLIPENNQIHSALCSGFYDRLYEDYSSELVFQYPSKIIKPPNV
jgi:hypothetical protein